MQDLADWRMPDWDQKYCNQVSWQTSEGFTEYTFLHSTVAL